MSNASLDLRITVKGDEVTLRDIQQKFTNPDEDCTSFSNALGVVIEQMLIAAGTTEPLDVKFHCGQVKSRFSTGGGLNSQEWLKDMGGSS